MKNLKLNLLFLLIFAGCSSIEVRPVGQLIKTNRTDLLNSSKELYKESGVTDFVPSEADKDKFYTGLEQNAAYKKYLITECILLLHKEQSLNLERPVFASDPKWNNLENFYTSFFSFQSLDKNALTEQTMECDVAVNKNKEVAQYQLKKSHIQFHKAL